MKSKRYALKYKGKTYGYSSGNPFKWAWVALYVGLFVYKYPLCCVTQYCWECIKNEPSWVKRQHEFNLKKTLKTNHIPCNFYLMMKGVRK